MRASAVSLSFAAMAFAAACTSNQPPSSSSRPRQGRGRLDSIPGNVVIENRRPDASARAGLLIVANQQAASATVLDAATLKTLVTLPVGVGPHEVAVSYDGLWAVVTNYGDHAAEGNTLSVIDLTSPGTPTVARTINLGEYHRPHGVAFVGSGNKLAVTSETSQRLLIVDFASGRVDTALATNGRGSHMVAAQRDGRRAWTANVQDGTVTEYDLDRRRTGPTFHAAPLDEGIAVGPGGNELWVGSNSAHTVTVLDAVHGTPRDTLTEFGTAYRIGISRSGLVAVISDPGKNRVWLYDAVERSRLAEIDIATVEGVRGPPGTPGAAKAGPEGIAFDPIANVAYVTLNNTNQVIAVDLYQRKVIGFGPVGAGPDGVAFSPYVR